MNQIRDYFQTLDDGNHAIAVFGKAARSGEGYVACFRIDFCSDEAEALLLKGLVTKDIVSAFKRFGRQDIDPACIEAAHVNGPNGWVMNTAVGLFRTEDDVKVVGLILGAYAQEITAGPMTVLKPIEGLEHLTR